MMSYSNQVILQQKKIGNKLIKHFSLARILLGILAFNGLQAMDSAKEYEKNQEKALIDQKTKNNQQATPNHQTTTLEKSAFFVGIGYSGMASGWEGIFRVGASMQPILNGFNVEAGYQHISKKYPNIGVRAGFIYSYKAQNLTKNYPIYNLNNNQPNQSIGISGLGISMNTYSVFVDFLNDFYQKERFFLGWFLGVGLGGESVKFSQLFTNPHTIMGATQFQGFGTLGLRIGDKHHTLELSTSIYGDAGNCSNHKSSCFKLSQTNTKSMYGLWGIYIAWNVNYVYRF